jgi:hypothetical protein
MADDFVTAGAFEFSLPPGGKRVLRTNSGEPALNSPLRGSSKAGSPPAFAKSRSAFGFNAEPVKAIAQEGSTHERYRGRQAHARLKHKSEQRRKAQA